jgi:hypothetical protein
VPAPVVKETELRALERSYAILTAIGEASIQERKADIASCVSSGITASTLIQRALALQAQN